MSELDDGTKDALVEVLQPLLKKVRTDVCAEKLRPPGKGSICVKKPLTKAMMLAHLNGGPGRGIYPMLPGSSTTMVALYDFDSHKGESTWEEMVAAAKRVQGRCRTHGLQPVPFRSSGGRGIHFLLQWEHAQDAYSVRQLMYDILEAEDLVSGTKGVKAGQVEVFPKQDSVGPDPSSDFGGMFILPLTGESVPLDPETLEPLDKGAALWMLWPESKPVPYRKRPEPTYVPLPDDVDLAELRSAVMAIPNDDVDYDEWLRVCAGIHHATGGSAEGLDLANEWSEQSGKHNPYWLERRTWPYFKFNKDKPVTSASIFAKAREHGWGRPSIDEMFPSGWLRTSLIDAMANVRPPFWLVQGMWRKGDVVALLGRPNSGKTAVGLDLALRVSLGWAVHGRKTARQHVLYLSAENSDGVLLRIQAWCKRNDVSREEVNKFFHFRGQPVDLADPKVVQAMARDLHDEFGDELGAIIVDTFSANFFGEDENSAAEVSKWFRNVRKYLAGPSVLIMHHPPKGSEDVLNWRGSGVAPGDLDSMWGAEIESTGTVVTLTQGKRRGPSFDELRWVLGITTLDDMVDNFGEKVTTVVANAASELEAGEAEDLVPVPRVKAAILDCIRLDKSMTMTRMAELSGVPASTIRNNIRYMKRDHLIGERGEILYLKSEGKSLLDHALAGGYVPINVEEMP